MQLTSELMQQEWQKEEVEEGDEGEEERSLTLMVDPTHTHNLTHTHSQSRTHILGATAWIRTRKKKRRHTHLLNFLVQHPKKFLLAL